MRWEDVDFEKQVTNVRRTVVPVTGHGLVVKAPKSNAGVRVLSMPKWLVELLQGRRQTADLDSPVFPSSVGGYRDRNNVERAFRRARQGTQFEWVVPHSYRKTVATLLDRGGLSARTIADQLGHARISMTQDVCMGRLPWTAGPPQHWKIYSARATTGLTRQLTGKSLMVSAANVTAR